MLAGVDREGFGKIEQELAFTRANHAVGGHDTNREAKSPFASRGVAEMLLDGQQTRVAAIPLQNVVGRVNQCLQGIARRERG